MDKTHIQLKLRWLDCEMGLDNNGDDEKMESEYFNWIKLRVGVWAVCAMLAAVYAFSHVAAISVVVSIQHLSDGRPMCTRTFRNEINIFGVHKAWGMPHDRLLCVECWKLSWKENW